MTTSKDTAKSNLPNFSHFLPEISRELEKVSDVYLDSYDIHSAFVYLIAELFETTNEENFVYTDGSGDGGIDFFIAESPTYSIFQCKCPVLDDLLNQESAEVSVPSFDKTPLQELLGAIEIMNDKKGQYETKLVIKRLRGDYQRDLVADKEATSLTATLAIMGRLTDTAKAEFRSHRALLAEKGVTLKLIEWHDIYKKLHALEAPENVDVNLDITFSDKETDILSHRDYCYVLAYAHDLYEAFRHHEWNLFDWNVRYQIPKSQINKRIINSLKTRKGRKNFHHLNNGLLITCRRYEGMKRPDNRLTLRGAQIINGCQTVRAICEAYEDLIPEEQAELRQDARVQVKVIQTTDPDFISDLVISTNDQNPMKPRNLKSNTAEQRDIQRQFNQLPMKWFYERKDGEWTSLITASSKVRWFRKSNYTVTAQGKGRRRYRRIDNERLSKAWYSFIGYSHRALQGVVDYFLDESGGVYRRVFKSTPSPAFWSAFREPAFTEKDDYLDPGTPSVYQYLIAYAIAEYIDARKIPSKRNRTETIIRGIKEGKLKGHADTGHCTSEEHEISEYLSKDNDYNVNRMIIYMREVLIELFSFVLTLRYGACDAASCQKFMTLPHITDFIHSDFDPSLLPIEQKGTALLGPIYEFLKYCVKQYYFEYQAEISAAPRLRAYQGQRSTVQKLRHMITQRDKSISDYDVKWKKVGSTFIESLPELS